MKIAVTGANGQLGTDLCEILSGGNQVTPLTHHEIEVTDIDNVRKILVFSKPEVLFNTAAYNLVPQAEQHPEKAFAVNGIGTYNIARVCSDLGIRLVHYSTDYVFDGKKNNPYSEDDKANPLNVYGLTKLSGEYFALNYCEKSFVIRISGIYGKTPSRSKGDNFITSILKMAREKSEVKVVNDERLTPSPTQEIAKNTATLIKTGAFGLYHMSCQGECSWYEFARQIWETLNIKTKLVPASVKDFPSAVKRPSYSVLENRNLQKLGIDEMPGWKEALVQFLTTHGHNLK